MYVTSYVWSSIYVLYTVQYITMKNEENMTNSCYISSCLLLPNETKLQYTAILVHTLSKMFLEKTIL